MLILALLLAVVGAGPLLFGAVYTWASLIQHAGVLLCLILALVWPRSLAPAGLSGGNWPFIPLLALLLVALFQVLPLPPGLAESLAPANAAFWREAYDLLGQGLSGIPLSLAPHLTLTNAVITLTYVVAAWLSFRLCTSGGDRFTLAAAESCLALTALVGVAISLIALAQAALDARAIYGFFKPLTSEHFYGTYVNRNHFAGWLELALPGSLALAAIEARRVKDNNSQASEHQGYAKALLWGLAGLVMLAALLGSMSRGGLVCGLSALLAQGALTYAALTSRRKWRSAGLALAILVAALVAAVSLADWDSLSRRFSLSPQATMSGSTRLQVYADTWRASQSHALLGTGLGSFAYVYPHYKTLAKQGLTRHAHNDYLEYLLEVGWVGLALLLSFWAMVLARGLRGVARGIKKGRARSGRETERLLALMGLLAGVAALLAHSLIDFNLRIPANGLGFFLFCGAALGLGTPSASPEPADQ